ncbi:hypothetical protein TSACC_21711 [Terrimicrobium sacchariphilum]|uniref:Uncharacterized protein n=1 Tax=Terrimicrobium sacchariphilum TaxID=690879 RepID=A0A146G9G2_TERSA|nr:hypothetical protein [Terrimicrobium sacchariphilum]GAT33298.1 hypothetical protein TSACC_21711 [Terrimicrobium sacchariphilum]
MPVRLAEIPNAPQAGGQPITSNGPGAAPDISSAARSSLLQSSVDINAFSGPAQAAQSVGEAIAVAGHRVGAAMTDFAQKRQNIQDMTADNQVDAEWAALTADVTAQTQGKPGDQWQGIFEKAYQEKAPNFNALIATASPEAQARIRGMMGTRYATTLGQFKVTGLQKALSDSKDINDAAIERAFQAGDYETVHTKIIEGEKNGLYTQGDAEKKRVYYDGRQQDDLLQTAVLTNPRAVPEMVKKGVFGELPDAKKAEVIYRADRAVKIDESEAWNEAQNMQAEGMTLDAIKKTLGDRLPERRAALLQKRAMAVRPYDPATDGPMVAEIQTLIRGYNGKDDPKNDQYNQIDERISTLPKEYQDRYRTELNQKWNKTWVNGEENPMKDKQLAQWGNEFERLSKAGYLGPTGRDKKSWEKVDDMAASAAWGQKYQDFQNQMADWATKNPQASPEEWRKKFAEIVGPEAAKHSTQSFMPQPTQEFGGGWNRHASAVNYGIPMSRPIFPNVPSVADVQNKVGVKVPSTYYTLGKSVGGTDETQDTWTNKGYSAKGENLTPGVVAVNTDKYPLGTIFRDPATGEAFIASDKHGNADPNVIDFYTPPSQYQAKKEDRTLQVVGKVAEKDIPKDAEGIRSLLAKYGTVPPGESAKESLAKSKLASK